MISSLSPTHFESSSSSPGSPSRASYSNSSNSNNNADREIELSQVRHVSRALSQVQANQNANLSCERYPGLSQHIAEFYNKRASPVGSSGWHHIVSWEQSNRRQQVYDNTALEAQAWTAEKMYPSKFSPLKTTVLNELQARRNQQNAPPSPLINEAEEQGVPQSGFQSAIVAQESIIIDTLESRAFSAGLASVAMAATLDVGIIKGVADGYQIYLMKKVGGLIDTVRTKFTNYLNNEERLGLSAEIWRTAEPIRHINEEIRKEFEKQVCDLNRVDQLRNELMALEHEYQPIIEKKLKEILGTEITSFLAAEEINADTNKLKIMQKVLGICLIPAVTALVGDVLVRADVISGFIGTVCAGFGCLVLPAAGSLVVSDYNVVANAQQIRKKADQIISNPKMGPVLNKCSEEVKESQQIYFLFTRFLKKVSTLFASICETIGIVGTLAGFGAIIGVSLWVTWGFAALGIVLALGIYVYQKVHARNVRKERERLVDLSIGNGAEYEKLVASGNTDKQIRDASIHRLMDYDQTFVARILLDQLRVEGSNVGRTAKFLYSFGISKNQINSLINTGESAFHVLDIGPTEDQVRRMEEEGLKFRRDRIQEQDALTFLCLKLGLYPHSG